MAPQGSFTTSGSSPPAEDTDSQPLSPELIDALANLLADALVADIRQYPHLAEVEASLVSTVEPPRDSTVERDPHVRGRRRDDPGALEPLPFQPHLPPGARARVPADSRTGGLSPFEHDGLGPPKTH